jgi:hypothetical protein
MPPAYANVRNIVKAQADLWDYQRVLGKFKHGFSADRALECDDARNGEIKSGKPAANRRVRRDCRMTVLYEKFFYSFPRIDVVFPKFSYALTDEAVWRAWRIRAFRLLGIQRPKPLAARASLARETELIE